MIKFYFDDYNEIKAENFEGKATLIEGDNAIKVLFFNDTCRLPFDISLRKKYKIAVENKEYPVACRFIVHTKRFEEEHSYDGPLGYQYSKEETHFYLWAPTAYGVTLVLNSEAVEMEYTDRGVYHAKVAGDCEGYRYCYKVTHESEIISIDPYAVSSGVNSKFNYVIDTSNLIPPIAGDDISSCRDAVIYETSVRDFTSDLNIPFENRGKFKGLCERGVTDEFGNEVGFDYVKNLGITHLQLMPVYDFGSIDESKATNDYNWGYDPVQYNLPEGSYSTNPDDPYCRINELTEVVNSYHKENIGVVMDVVYNHVYDDKTFSFSKIVPYYFFRYNKNTLSDASYCGNEVASERYMVRRFIVDSLCYLTEKFGFDGYRFDLMGIIDIKTMNIIEEKLRAINPNIYLFGEGWSMPTAIDQRRCATQRNNKQLGEVGFFNDDFRNTVKQLIIGHINSNKEDVIIRLLLGLDYNNPQRSLQYISCHDDYTIFDQLHYDFVEQDIENKVKQGYIFVFLGQGNPFLHSGCEFLRTKLGIKNSFKSSAEINRIDWSLISKNKELVQFVKELIRLRNSADFPLFKTEEEILANSHITIDNDIISYKSGGLLIYINLNCYEVSINCNLNLISKDGYEENSYGDTQIRHYAVYKEF